MIDDINVGQRAQHMGPNSVGQLPETLADRSNSLQRLAGTVYRQGGRGGEVVADSLTRRQRGPANLYDRGGNVQTNQIGQRGQARDMYEQFERALRVRTSDTPAQTVSRLRQEASAEGNQLYGAAMQNQQPFRIEEEVADALRRSQDMGATPIGRSLRKAARYFMGSPTSPRGHQMSPLERFDTAKKALDDDIGAAVSSNKGNLARELTEFKNRMLTRVDDSNPDYATARSAWGGKKEQQEAVEMGRAAFKENSEITADAYRALSVPLQRLFRVGMLDAQRAMTRTANPGTDVSRLFQQQRVVELMREVIPNSQRANDVFGNRSGRFGEYVNRQGRMAQTRNTAMGGSPTARNQLDDNAEAIRTLSQVWDQFRQNPSITRMLMDGVGVLGNRYLGFREDVSVQIARRLMQMNPEAQIRYLQGLEQRVGADPLQGFMEGLQNLSQHAIREGSKAAGRNLVEEDEAR
tara:strand:+ start:343 stop:1737 length:1395 start_codon:yes stop_codon:yes gene_type:complete